jgi:hypothetical protein
MLMVWPLTPQTPASFMLGPEAVDLKAPMGEDTGATVACLLMSMVSPLTLQIPASFTQLLRTPVFTRALMGEPAGFASSLA